MNSLQMYYIVFLTTSSLINMNNAGKIWKESLSEVESMEENEILSASIQFDSFIQTYNKSYELAEEKERRFQIFLNNLKRIEALQKDDQGTAEYGVTKFADLTYEEFTQKYVTSRIFPNLKTPTFDLHRAKSENLSAMNVSGQQKLLTDWSKSKFPGKVHDQGDCGCCYAFASVSMLEFLLSKKMNKQIYLSTQYVVECYREYYNNEGCKGGSIVGTLYALKHSGIPPENVYPYTGLDIGCVDLDPKKVPFYKIKDSLRIQSGEMRMMEMLPSSPIVVLIHPAILQLYKKGIAAPSAEACPREPKKGFDYHAMVIVGDGVEDKVFYFKLRNSFGVDFGEQGHLRIKVMENICGVSNLAMYGVI